MREKRVSFSKELDRRLRRHFEAAFDEDVGEDDQRETPQNPEYRFEHLSEAPIG